MIYLELRPCRPTRNTPDTPLRPTRHRRSDRGRQPFSRGPLAASLSTELRAGSVEPAALTCFAEDFRR